MRKTLGASLFIYNGETHDYCYKEAVACMKEFADQVAIVDAGSTDGTADIVKSFEDSKTRVLCLPNEIWNSAHGKEKLSLFSNMAHSLLSTDYFFNLQGDEILHENSYDALRQAIETGYEGFLCKRINLWKDCYNMLNVPQHRKPCSTEVRRLSVAGRLSIDDAESIDVQCVEDFVDDIMIVHYGFVRKKEVMKSKISHMQKQVFGMLNHDEKLDKMDVFDWSAWFSESDLLPFDNHPKIMREWVKTRP